MRCLQHIRKILIICVAFLAAAQYSAQSGELDGVTLRVGTWGGAWMKVQQTHVVPKMEALGAKVEFVQGSPQANMARLIAARGAVEPPIDVLEIIDANLPDMLRGNFLRPLDMSLVPNAKHVNKARVTEKAIATWTTQESICYLPGQFEKLGLPAPMTYADLAHPKLAGRVMLPHFTAGSGLAAVAGMAYAEGGDLTNIKPGLDLMSRMKGVKFWKLGADSVTAMKAGDVDASVIHSGVCLRGVESGLKAAVANPRLNEKFTGVVKQGWIGVVNGTKNSTAAHIYLNEFISTAFQVIFSEEVGTVPENLEAAGNLGGNMNFKKLMVLDPAQTEAMLRPDFSKVNLTAWGQQWNRAVAQ